MGLAIEINEEIKMKKDRFHSWMNEKKRTLDWDYGVNDMKEIERQRQRAREQVKEWEWVSERKYRRQRKTIYNISWIVDASGTDNYICAWKICHFNRFQIGSSAPFSTSIDLIMCWIKQSKTGFSFWSKSITVFVFVCTCESVNAAVKKRNKWVSLSL